jgi:hypothetical protein
MSHRRTPIRFVRVILSCGHDNQYREPAPHDGDLLWCYKCSDHKIVEKVGQKFRVKCVRAGCTYTKRTGMSQRHAEQFAAKHHFDRKHPVNVYDGYKLVSKYRGEPNPDQLELQFDNEVPPF